MVRTHAHTIFVFCHLHKCARVKHDSGERIETNHGSPIATSHLRKKKFSQSDALGFGDNICSDFLFNFFKVTLYFTI